MTIPSRVIQEEISDVIYAYRGRRNWIQNGRPLSLGADFQVRKYKCLVHIHIIIVYVEESIQLGRREADGVIRAGFAEKGFGEEVAPVRIGNNIVD